MDLWGRTASETGASLTDLDDLRSERSRQPAASEDLASVGAEVPASPVTPSGHQEGRSRFVRFVLAGVAVVVTPYLWVLSDLWNSSPSLLRTAQLDGYASNFYDLQARAMLHGHLYVANGALGGEAFVHAGRQYTYFGIFPSLLRMPILVVTHSLDGRLTALSMLMAWLVTALFSSLLVWRVRTMAVGASSLSRTEAATYAVLLATIMGGSVLVFLASDPWVFSEDLAWSVALSVGSLFALIGVLERPSTGRVVGCGLLILAANLTRSTTGTACVIGAILVGLWFATGRGGVEQRRWSVPVLLAGLVPLAAGCAVDYAKFGILIGLPASDQIGYQLFNLGQTVKGGYFNLHFIPTSLLAYFQPGGLRLSHLFPFITLPSYPAKDLGGVAGFGSDRVASVPASMPLLLVGALWGTFATFRTGTSRGLRLLRIPLLAAGAAAATVMVYGWTENRFVADLMPLLILGGAIGLIDVCRRVRSRSHVAQRLVLVVVAVFGVYGVVTNVAMASTFQSTWSTTQALHYVDAQRSVAGLTGQSLRGEIVRGRSLPTSAPGDALVHRRRLCRHLYHAGRATPEGSAGLRNAACPRSGVASPGVAGQRRRHGLPPCPWSHCQTASRGGGAGYHWAARFFCGGPPAVR